MSFSSVASREKEDLEGSLYHEVGTDPINRQNGLGLTRSLCRLSLVMIVAVSLLLMFTASSSSTSHSRSWKDIGRLVQDMSTTKKTTTDDVFMDEGMLAFDKSHQIWQWTSFNRPNATTDCVSSFVSYSSTFGNETMQEFTLEIFRNKRVLFVGDSVDRNMNNAFCHLFKGKIQTLSTYITDLDESLADKVEFLNSRSFVCHIESMNFTSFNLMMYGVSQDDNLWSYKTDLSPPFNAVSRLQLFSEVAKGIDFRPHLIVLASALWDLAAFNVERAKLNLPKQIPLDLPMLQSYRSGLTNLTTEVRSLFPYSRHLLRTQHMTKESEGSWFLLGLNTTGLERIPRMPYGDARVEQLNSMAIYTARELNLPLFPWAHVMVGYETLLSDDVHPGTHALFVSTNMICSYLRD